MRCLFSTLVSPQLGSYAKAEKGEGVSVVQIMQKTLASAAPPSYIKPATDNIFQSH